MKKYLNLTKGFNPYNSTSTNEIKYDSLFFNGGEPHIKIEFGNFPFNKAVDAVITSRLTSMDELVMVMIAADALNQSGKISTLTLVAPYIPGARQDVRHTGEALTSKIIANMINSCKFDEVVTFDNHSPVITALLKNVTEESNHDFVLECLKRIHTNPKEKAPLLISPDAGSNKKIKELAMYLNEINDIEVIKCDKTRDFTTGKLSGFEVYANDLDCQDCIIVDDICDGGGTFIGLAEELKKKNAGKIYLVVSHGIFSQPLKNLKTFFEKVYTTDSWRSDFSDESKERDATELVEIVPLSTII